MFDVLTKCSGEGNESIRSNLVETPKKQRIHEEVIEILESDREVDIVSLSSPPPLRDTINKHKARASEIRLNTKPAGNGLSEKSKDWLNKRKEATANAADPKKNGPITFRCDLFLHSASGKRTGTRVPAQSRGFQQTDVSDITITIR